MRQISSETAYLLPDDDAFRVEPLRAGAAKQVKTTSPHLDILHWCRLAAANCRLRYRRRRRRRSR